MKFFKAPGLSIILFLGLLHTVIAKPVIIQGKLTYKASQTKVYIYKYLGNSLYKFDSTSHKEGVFAFNYKEPIARGFYKIGFEDDNAIVVILGDESITITGNPEIAKSIVLKGSKENDTYGGYQKINEFQNLQMTQISQKAQQLSQQSGITEELYNKQIQPLKNTQDSLNKSYNKKMEALIAANPTLFMTKVVAMFMTDGKTADNFFTATEFSDKEYAAGDMLPSKTQMYFQYIIPQDLTAWKNASKQLLNRCPVGSDNKHVFYATIIPLFVQNDVDFAKTLALDFIKEYPASPVAKGMLESMPKGTPGIGDIAPDIALTDANGVTHSLNSLKGKVVLLDFWASWCGPCRGENPNVVNAYSKYKDKGFTVFSVSLDTNKDQWVAAINKDGLIWPNHVSDLKGWKSAPAQLYNVRGIPATFLIDQQGKVIATNLRGEDLQSKLEELLNKP